jgi:zinc protease
VRKITVKLPAKLPYLLMGYKTPSLLNSTDETEAYALEVLAAILDGGDSARLSKHLIRGQQIASSTSAHYDLSTRLPNLLLLEATPADGKTVLELEAALKTEVKALQTELVTAEELQRVKAQVLANNVYQRDSNFYQAMLLGLFETVGLGWKKVNEYVDKVKIK